MMIVMKTVARGPDFAADEGQLVEVDEARGRDLIESGHAYAAAEFMDAPDGEPVAATPAAKRRRATADRRATR